jgi:hypothetical protein
MDTTVHELADAIESGIAHALSTGESVTAAAAVVAATHKLDARELEVCTTSVRLTVAPWRASISVSQGWGVRVGRIRGMAFSFLYLVVRLCLVGWFVAGAALDV